MTIETSLKPTEKKLIKSKFINFMEIIYKITINFIQILTEFMENITRETDENVNKPSVRDILNRCRFTLHVKRI